MMKVYTKTTQIWHSELTNLGMDIFVLRKLHEYEAHLIPIQNPSQVLIN